jgi:hypothetical protein
MNIASRTYAQELISDFHQNGTLPYGCRRPLPADEVPEHLDVYTKMFDTYKSVDDTAIDERSGKGTIVMTSPEFQWCLNYKGDPKNGELKETYERDTFHDHCHVRYGPGRVDVLNMHVVNDGIVAQALQLDRRQPENSSVLVYQWNA